MPPSYVPRLTPEQEQQAMIMQRLGSRMSPQQLTYDQWLAMHGQGIAAPTQRAGSGVGSAVSAIAEDKGPGLLESLFSSSTPAAANAATPGATAGMSMLDGSMMAGGQEVGGMSLAGGGSAAIGPGNTVLASSAPEAAGAFDLAGIGSAGNAFLPAAGLAGEFDLWKNKRKGARGHLQGAASLAAMGSYFGPYGALIGAGVGALQPFLMHESTRERAKRHTQELSGKSNDPTYQNYIKGMRQQYEAPPPDPTHPFHGGKYKTWQEYQAAGLDPNDLTGVFGNINTYGPEWAKLTEDQRRAVTKANIDSGLYRSKKGEVEISDANKAKANFDAVVKGAGPVGTSVPVGVQIPKRSPGFDKNGKRINY